MSEAYCKGCRSKWILIDVAVPCDTGDNLKVSCDHKRNGTWISGRSWAMSLCSTISLLEHRDLGFIVLKQLEISRKYAPLFKRLCCHDVIAGSSLIPSCEGQINTTKQALSNTFNSGVINLSRSGNTPYTADSLFSARPHPHRWSVASVREGQRDVGRMNEHLESFLSHLDYTIYAHILGLMLCSQ